MPTRFYLASTSPARRALLAQTGIEPVLVSPGVDEDAVAAAEAARRGRALDGPELVSLLAVAKAEAVADGRIAGTQVDGLVFGGDSAFEVDGVLYGKPHDPAVARARWRTMLAAGGGVLWSGHCLIDRRVERPSVTADLAAAAGSAGPAAPGDTSTGGVSAPAGPGSWMRVEGNRVVAVDSARLTFADDIDPEEIDAYVQTGEPLEVAGAFTIDGFAAAYISRIDGAPSAVIGLSLPTLRAMVQQGLGIRWHDLWNAL